MYFGIGWHKTGTTSLTEAFSLLGVSAKHNPYLMYGEYAAGNRTFASFDDCDFVCDGIIHAIFKELDRHYLGSKFILTTRDTASWLKSVKKHFENGFAPRLELEGSCVWDEVNERRHVHGIHELMYGRRTFDPDVFARRFEDHNRLVLEYFAGRENELLSLDIDSEDFDWEKLCAFLNLDIPDAPFPHLRKSAGSENLFNADVPAETLNL